MPPLALGTEGRWRAVDRMRRSALKWQTVSSSAVRPRFSQVLDLSLEEAQGRIVTSVRGVDDRCEVKSFPQFICVRVPEDERHFWSPRLHLMLEEESAARTRVAGCYGANANAWALLLFGYMILGSFALFAGTLGYAQLTVGNYPWGLWIFGVMVAALLGLFLAARKGKKLGDPQREGLHRIYERAMGPVGDPVAGP